MGDPPLSQALPRKHPDFDFRLIEPTSVRGRVVNRKSIPDLAAELGAVEVRQWLLVMDVQIPGADRDLQCQTNLIPFPDTRPAINSISRPAVNSNDFRPLLLCTAVDSLSMEWDKTQKNHYGRDGLRIAI